MIGPETSHQPLNQSNAKVKTIATFSRRSSNLLVFTLSSHWLMMMQFWWCNSLFWLVTGITLVFWHSMKTNIFLWNKRQLTCYKFQNRSLHQNELTASSRAHRLDQRTSQLTIENKTMERMLTQRPFIEITVERDRTSFGSAKSCDKKRKISKKLWWRWSLHKSNVT